MQTFADVWSGYPPDHPIWRRVEIHHAEPFFRCRCRALVTLDMMLCLEPVEGEQWREGERPERWGDDLYRCDACWRTDVATGRVCPDRLRAVTGQPPRGEGKPW